MVSYNKVEANPFVLTISNQLLVNELNTRGWRNDILDEQSGCIRFWAPDGKSYIVRGARSYRTWSISGLLVDNKMVTYKLAAELGVKIPATEEFTSMKRLYEFLQQNQPIVIKPQNSSHGNGVTTNITTQKQARKAVLAAKEFTKRIVLQEQVYGDDYRLLMFDDQLEAAVIREPASVTGDGKHTIQQLIALENKRKDRGMFYQKPLNFIDIEAVNRWLSPQLLTTVPNGGESVVVVGTANIGTGGKSIDVTDSVPPQMLEDAKTFAQYLHLGVSGIDFMYDAETGRHWLIEVNASPSFGLHEMPSEGMPRPIAHDFINWLCDIRSNENDV